MKNLVALLSAFRAYATPELYQWFDKESKKAVAPQQ